MDTKTIDAGEFREGQRHSWDTAATGWRKWSELIDSSASHISERMVELAGVTAGSRVLDVAAGYGEPSLTAARIVGANGKVVASDISAEMLAYGRERAGAAGLDNIEFVQSDAVSLAFPAGSFDAALSRFGIIFDPDGEGAAARVRSFLEPGARMAIASWGAPERVPFLSVPMQAAVRHVNAPPPPPGMPGPLSRPTPEALGGLLEGGGFTDIEVEESEVQFGWDSAEEFTMFLKDIAPPIHAILEPYPEQVREEAWAAITEKAAELSTADGALEFRNLALIACGRA